MHPVSASQAQTIAMADHVVPPGWLIGATTRLIDSWFPAPEVIRLPELRIEQTELSLSLVDGASPAPRQSLRRRAHNLRHRKPRTLQGAPDTVYYDGRHDGFHNFSHMFFEVGLLALAAQRFFRERTDFSEFRMLVRSTARPFAIRALEELGLRVIATDADLHGPTIRVSERGRLPALRITRDILPADLTRKIVEGPPTPERVYIARRGTRSIVNEQQTDPIIAEHGYTKLYLEDLDVLEQIRTVARARSIVAVHGAALGPLVCRAILPNPAVELIEIFGPGYVNCLYREIVAGLGGSWIGVRGRVTPDVVRDVDQRGDPRAHETSDIDLDPAALRLALEHARGGFEGMPTFSMAIE